MKKTGFLLLVSLTIFIFAVLVVPTSSVSAETQPVICPVGYTCKPCPQGSTCEATSQPANCPSGYSCKLTNSVSESPVISGLTAPTALAVGQNGTWFVRASDPKKGPLTYYVSWGDENKRGLVGSEPGVQTATFTHAYQTAGTYKVIFSVTNESGLVAQTSATVKVGDEEDDKGEVSITNTRATLDDPIMNANKVVAYPFSLAFTVNNAKDEPIYLSSMPSKVIRLSTVNSPSTMNLANMVLTPSSLAGDAQNVFVIPAGSSRSVTVKGVLKNENGTPGQKEVKVTGISYLNFGKGSDSGMIEKGLEKLRLSTYMDSEGTSTSQASITVLSPTGGTYRVGKSMQILWNTTNIPSDQELNISLFLDTRGIGKPIATVKNTGSYTWEVKDIEPFYDNESRRMIYPNGNYRITISCPTDSAICNNMTPNFGDSAVFTIASSTTSTAPSLTILSPVGERTYEFGSTMQVAWDAQNIDADYYYVLLENTAIKNLGVVVTRNLPRTSSSASFVFNKNILNAFIANGGGLTEKQLWNRYYVRVVGIKKGILYNTAVINGTSGIFGFSTVENSKGVTVSGTKATLGSPVVSKDMVVGYPVSFTFTLNNQKQTPIYVSSTATNILTLNTDNRPSTVELSDAVGSSPATFAGDSEKAFAIPSGTSRTFTIYGSINNNAGTEGLKTLKVVGISYVNSTNDQRSEVVREGLELLRVSTVMSGVTENSSLVIRNASARLGPAILKGNDVYAYNYDMSLVVANTGKFDVYMSSKEDGTDLNAVISPDVASVKYVKSWSPTTLAGDTSAVIVIPSGSSRTMKMTGQLTNVGKPTLVNYKITSLNYGTTSSNPKALSITTGLENLKISANFGEGSATLKPTPSPTPWMTSSPVPQPSINYIQAPAANMNQIYAGQRAVIYGTNLNTDISVRLLGKAYEENVSVYSKTYNSASFTVPSNVSSGTYTVSLIYKAGETKQVQVQVVSPQSSVTPTPTPYYSTPSPTPYASPTASPSPSPSPTPTPTPTPYYSTPSPSPTPSPTPYVSSTPRPSTSPSPSSSPTAMMSGKYSFQASLWSALASLFGGQQ